MSSTIPPSHEGILYNDPNDLQYFIGVTIGVIILIICFVILSYCCTNEHNSPSQPQQRDSQPPDDSSITLEGGIDEATLRSYPKLLYSEVKLHKKNIITTTTTTTPCCSICLVDYNITDTLRLLPNCGHLFHLKCVDPWLRQHPTCPICRSSSMPAPVSTSLAETIPLSNQIV